MDFYPSGDAIFSTYLHKYSQRAASIGPIILRSSPDDDQDSMVARLRQDFPLQCKEIVIPVESIYHWFDPYDAHRHGYAFLYSVLTTIAIQNSIRARQVRDFAELWRAKNPGRFRNLAPASQVLFTNADIEQYGRDFLADAFHVLQALKLEAAAAHYLYYITSDPKSMCHVDNRYSFPAYQPDREPVFSSIQNPPKVASDDTRVLELRQHNRGTRASFKNVQGVATAQPLHTLWQPASVIHSQVPPSSKLTQAVPHPEDLSCTISNDPAVVFVGKRSRDGDYCDQLWPQPNRFLPNAEQHRNENRQSRRWSCISTSDNPAAQQVNDLRVYVGNLPPAFTVNMTKALFGPNYQITKVSEVKTKDRRGRGFAFVTFSKQSEAAEAIKRLDSTYPASCDGRRLIVSQAYWGCPDRNRDGSQNQQPSFPSARNFEEANELTNSDGPAKKPSKRRMDDHEGYPPLVKSHPGSSWFKPLSVQPRFEVSTTPQLQSEVHRTKRCKNEQLDNKSGSADMTQELHWSEDLSPTETNCRDNILADQNNQNSSSQQVNEPTPSVRSEPSICNANGARISTDMTTEPQFVEVPPISTQSESGSNQLRIENSYSEAEKLNIARECVKVVTGQSEIDERVTIPVIVPALGSSLEESTLVAESHLTTAATFPTSKSSKHHLSLDMGDSTVSHVQGHSQIERNEFTTPNKEHILLDVKPSPETPPSSPVFSSTSKLNKRRPELPSRTSSVSVPAIPIVTHKKKLKVFTPLKESFSQSFEARIEDSQPSSASNMEDNYESLTTLYNARPPPNSEQDKSHPKGKNMARRAKNKPKRGKSPSDLLDNKTSGSASVEKPINHHPLPAPERPYLVDDRVILPKIDKPMYPSKSETSNEASPTATVKSFETFKNPDRSESSASTFGRKKVSELFTHLSNEASTSSDLPFRDRYPNIDSFISTTAVYASLSRPSTSSVESSVDKSLSNDDELKRGATPRDEECPSSGSIASTPSTAVRKQPLSLTSPKHYTVYLDRDTRGSGSSTPTRRGRGFYRGHNRGASSTSSQLSSAEIAARNTGESTANLGASLSRVSSSVPGTPATPPEVRTLTPRPLSLPRTPVARVSSSYAAVARSPWNAPAPLSPSGIIDVASSGPLRRDVEEEDPWHIPKGEKVWGSGLRDR